MSSLALIESPRAVMPGTSAGSLYADLLHILFSFGSLLDLSRTSAVCRSWRRVLYSPPAPTVCTGPIPSYDPLHTPAAYEHVGRTVVFTLSHSDSEARLTQMARSPLRRYVDALHAGSQADSFDAEPLADAILNAIQSTTDSLRSLAVHHLPAAQVFAALSQHRYLSQICMATYGLNDASLQLLRSLVVAPSSPIRAVRLLRRFMFTNAELLGHPVVELISDRRSRLEVLTLEGVEWDRERAVALADAVASSEVIRCISIRGRFFAGPEDSVVTAAVIRAIRKNSRIDQVILQNMELGETGLQALADSFHLGRKLHTLRLESYKVKSQSPDPLLRQAASLTQLISQVGPTLVDCQLQCSFPVEGATRLVAALADTAIHLHTFSLQLHVKSGDWTDEEHSAWYQTVTRVVRSLTRLTLIRCELRDEGIEALVAELRHTINLSCLNIMEWFFSDESLSAISSCITQTATVRYLKLESVEASSIEGARSLLHAVRCTPSITSVEITIDKKCVDSVEVAAELHAVLQLPPKERGVCESR